MKIPKRIDTLIDKRLLLAERLNSVDIEICEWMESKGMDLSDMEDFTRTGCMIYCNYIYEDGKIAKTVDTPSAPQALCVGSPLGLNTIIPTTNGYKTMETIEVGDFVFGLDNKKVKVIKVHEIHKSNQ